MRSVGRGCEDANVESHYRSDEETQAKTYHATRWLAGEELGRTLRAMRHLYFGPDIVRWQPLDSPPRDAQLSYGVYAKFEFKQRDVDRVLGKARQSWCDEYVYSNTVALNLKFDSGSGSSCCAMCVVLKIIWLDEVLCTHPSIRVMVKAGAVSSEQRSYKLSASARFVDFPDRQLRSEKESCDGGKNWQWTGMYNASLSITEGIGGLTHALLRGDALGLIIRIDCSQWDQHLQCSPAVASAPALLPRRLLRTKQPAPAAYKSS